MNAEHDFSRVQPFEIHRPAVQTAPIVFNAPHSGRHYPPAFLAASRLDPFAIRRSEDAFVDELFLSAPEAGMPLLAANFPRAYLDVNREPYELDPHMFDTRLPPYANIRSQRVAGGLGTIARVVADRQEIYAGPIPVETALTRIELLYKPYHGALRRLLAETHVQFGTAVLLDCHSMPTTIRSITGSNRPDFVLGDRFGASCAPQITETVESVLIGNGYTVSRNKPYAGGFITEHYGRPAKGLHALQIEIARSLYLDEARVEKRPGFAALKETLRQLVEALAAIPLDGLVSNSAAAE